MSAVNASSCSVRAHAMRARIAYSITIYRVPVRVARRIWQDYRTAGCEPSSHAQTRCKLFMLLDMEYVDNCVLQFSIGK
eukprot:IDg11663t1